MNRLEELLPAAAWRALEADIAELQRVIKVDGVAEELHASKVNWCKLKLHVALGCKMKQVRG